MTEGPAPRTAPAAEDSPLGLFIGQAPVAIAMFDRDMRYLAASGGWVDAYGLEARDLRGQSVYEVFPQMPPEWRAIHQRALAGETISADEDPFVRDNGETQWLRWDVRPWRDAAGEVGGIIIFSEDITERRAMREAMARAQRLDALGRLAGGVAHDINNLLMVIGGNLELAEAGVADAEARERLRRALEAVQAGRAFSQRLLAIARAGPLEARSLDLNRCVEAVTELLRGLLDQRVRLTTRLAADLPSVVCDEGELTGALINLVTNARDAMAVGGDLVIETAAAALDEASARRHPGARPGDFVRLSVIDTGAGMTAEVAARAFEPFFTTKAPGEGTGLGLIGVHSFARQSGGFVTLESAPGRGARIEIHLPQAAAEPAGAAEPAEVPMGEGETVLVVDDEPQVREVTMRRLEALGYSVTEAASGPEAMGLLEGGLPVDVVLSDIVMPGGMSGYDLAHWIGTTWPEVRVILASGYLPSATGGEEAGGAWPVLAKPFSREALARAVSAALGPADGGRVQTSPAKT